MAEATEPKFIDLPQQAQVAHVHDHFDFRQEAGWYTKEGEFAGANEQDVIAALIDLEEAEINSIGDCMTGFCVVQPKFTDFVRKPFRRRE